MSRQARQMSDGRREMKLFVDAVRDVLRLAPLYGRSNLRNVPQHERFAGSVLVDPKNGPPYWA